jgi:hypothetical protein
MQGAIKDTLAMGIVPRESRVLGLAGTVPYLFTSVSTVYLGWDLAQEWPTGSAFKDAILLNRESAEYLMSVIEPLQLGYGAVIISFLGAIHWVSSVGSSPKHHNQVLIGLLGSRVR